MPEVLQRILSKEITLRPVVIPDDDAFLQDLYATTREDDMAMWGMPEDQARSLVDMQYRAQKMQYEAEYPGARHEIILFQGRVVGRLMSKITETEVFGIDIAILSEFRSQGVGSIVVRDLMREAEESNKPFNFSVVKTNFKAIKLYQHLGVEFVGETVSHYLLHWQADNTSKI